MKKKKHFNFFSLGSSEAILVLTNAGANVEAADKDGLTGNYYSLVICLWMHLSTSSKIKIVVIKTTIIKFYKYLSTLYSIWILISFERFKL